MTIRFLPVFLLKQPTTLSLPTLTVLPSIHFSVSVRRTSDASIHIVDPCFRRSQSLARVHLRNDVESQEPRTRRTSQLRISRCQSSVERFRPSVDCNRRCNFPGNRSSQPMLGSAYRPRRTLTIRCHNGRLRAGGVQSVICVICRVVASAGAETTLITSSAAAAACRDVLSLLGGGRRRGACRRGAPPPRNPCNRYRVLSSANANHSSHTTALTRTPVRWACLYRATRPIQHQFQRRLRVLLPLRHRGNRVGPSRSHRLADGVAWIENVVALDARRRAWG